MGNPIGQAAQRNDRGFLTHLMMVRLGHWAVGKSWMKENNVDLGVIKPWLTKGVTPNCDIICY